MCPLDDFKYTSQKDVYQSFLTNATMSVQRIWYWPKTHMIITQKKKKKLEQEKKKNFWFECSVIEKS